MNQRYYNKVRRELEDLFHDNDPERDIKGYMGNKFKGNLKVQKELKWIHSQEWEFVSWRGDYSHGTRGNDPRWWIHMHQSVFESSPVTEREIINQLYTIGDITLGDDYYGISIYLVDEQD